MNASTHNPRVMQRGFTLSQLLVAIAALSLCLGLLLPALAKHHGGSPAVAATAQPSTLTIAAADCALTMTDRDITLSAGNTVIEQFRIVTLHKADAYSRVEALLASSVLSPSAVGSRVRLIVEESADALTISYRTDVTRSEASKPSLSWPAPTRTQGDGVTTLTFRKDRP